MKHTSLLFVLLAITAGYSYAKDYKVSSPDGKITLTVSPATDLNWSVSYEGKAIISSAKAGMVLADGRILGSE